MEGIQLARKDYVDSKLLPMESKINISIDSENNVKYKSLIPLDGIYVLNNNTTELNVKNKNILKTNNLTPTSISNIINGEIGQKINLIIDDNFTTVVNNSNLILKQGSNLVATRYQSLELLCLNSSSLNNQIWLQL